MTWSFSSLEWMHFYLISYLSIMILFPDSDRWQSYVEKPFPSFAWSFPPPSGGLSLWSLGLPNSPITCSSLDLMPGKSLCLSLESSHMFPGCCAPLLRLIPHFREFLGLFPSIIHLEVIHWEERHVRANVWIPNMALCWVISGPFPQENCVFHFLEIF